MMSRMSSRMKIGVLGGGNLGAALARLAIKAGHDVMIGQRDPLSRRTDIPQATIDEAAAYGDVVILGLPYLACAEVLPRLSASLAEKIVVDATNPLNPDWSPVLLGQNNSAAEEISRLLPAARMVKAFNTVFADIMSEDRLNREGGLRATTFIASDDVAAAQQVAVMAESMGFSAISVGALANARYLEAMAHLNIAIAVGCKGGTDAAFIYDQRRA